MDGRSGFGIKVQFAITVQDGSSKDLTVYVRILSKEMKNCFLKDERMKHVGLPLRLLCSE